MGRIGLKTIGFALAIVFAKTSAFAGIVPSGKCAYTVASRQTLNEVSAFIATQLHPSHIPYLRVVRTQNNWFAVTVGDVPIDDFQGIKARLVSVAESPADAYCSNGNRYVEIVPYHRYSPFNTANFPENNSAANFQIGATNVVQSTSQILEPDEEAIGKWRYDRKLNPIDDSPTITLYLTADLGASRLGRSVSLIARCKAGESEFYVNWNDYLGDDNPTVIMRLGNTRAFAGAWSASTDNEATFYPENVPYLLQQLTRVDRLVLQTTPYNESPVTAVFDVRGLSEALPSLARACRWG